MPAICSKAMLVYEIAFEEWIFSTVAAYDPLHNCEITDSVLVTIAALKVRGRLNSSFHWHGFI